MSKLVLVLELADDAQQEEINLFKRVVVEQLQDHDSCIVKRAGIYVPEAKDDGR